MKKHFFMKTFVSLPAITLTFLLITTMSHQPAAAKVSDFYDYYYEPNTVDYFFKKKEAESRITVFTPPPGTCFECGKERVLYDSMYDGSYEMTRYSGRFVALLIPDTWSDNIGFTEEEIRQLLDYADVMYQHIYELTGIEPYGEGLLPIAFVRTTCGWGCGYIGSKGVEIMEYDHGNYLIREALQNGIPHGVFYHEMVHNFDIFHQYLKHGKMDHHAWSDFMDHYLNYYGRWGYNEFFPNNSPDNQIESWLEQIWEPYANDPTATWKKCVRDGVCPQYDPDKKWEAANHCWGGFNSAMGLIYGPDAIKKMFAFLREYINNNDPPTTDEGKADLNIEALAAGAEINLNCYVDKWRWYASPELRSKMVNLYGEAHCENNYTPPPYQPWPQQPWGEVLHPLYDGRKLHLEAVSKNNDVISGQPDNIRFWASGYGFIGTSPLNSKMILDWVPNPPLQFGSYGLRAQLMQGETPATNVTPLTFLSNQDNQDLIAINNINVASGRPYEVVYEGINEGAPVYIDRDYTITGYPASLEGAVYIRTANDDKKSTAKDFLIFDVNRGVTVYVAYDPRIANKPAWLDAFAQTGDDLVTTDPWYPRLSMFAKDFHVGTVTLGGNAGHSDNSMYVVIVVPLRSLEAEDAKVISGKFEIGSDPNASGGQYVWAPNGSGSKWTLSESHRVEYGFTVEEEGYYRIKAGVLAPNDNEDSFYVRVDNEPSAGYLWDVMQNTTYVSDFVSDRGGEDPVEVCLTGGTHTVGIYLREDGTRLDTIRLEFVHSDSCF